MGILLVPRGPEADTGAGLYIPVFITPMVASSHM